MRLRDKVCVVTGSGSGIGRATAIEMAREGAKVVVSDLNDDNGAETVTAITEKGSMRSPLNFAISQMAGTAKPRR